MTAVDTFAGSRPPRENRLRRALATTGRTTRARLSFTLVAAALAFGVVREAFRPAAWRRPVRLEFARTLRSAIAGGLGITTIAAALIGIIMIYQALFWLEEAGQEGLIGGILVTVLLREVTPLLVGFVVLGRSGANTAAEIGALQLGGEVERVAAQGIDPFLLLILPRAVALAVACYTLGVVFMLVAMAVGLAVADLGRGVLLSTWQFFATVLGAMQPRDFAIFPAKMLVIGLLIAVTSALSGLTVRPDEAANLLPRSFVRGVLAIMITSLTLSLAV